MRLPPGGQTADGFALTGPSIPFDRRTVAVRPDLADIRLADRYFAPHYAAAVVRRVTIGTDLRRDRARDAAVLASLRPGETFELLDLIGDDGWGIAVTKGLVGYVDATALDDPA